MVHKGSKLAFIPLSRLIPEPRPFSHHVLVMSCEAKVRANAWSYLEGGAKSLRVSLDCPMLHNTHRCRNIDRRPPWWGRLQGGQRGIWHAYRRTISRGSTKHRVTRKRAWSQAFCDLETQRCVFVCEWEKESRASYTASALVREQHEKQGESV